MERNGIDISHHQGDINFYALNGNIDFAMVRTSYGAFYEDEKHKQYLNELERIGVPYGLYHFSYATSVEDAKREAEGFIELIKKYKPMYPVAFVIESSAQTADVMADTLVEITSTFCTMVEQAGYYVTIYANLDYLTQKLNDPVLDKFDKWLAQWSGAPTYNKDFGLWQYSSKGSKPGIIGNVDLNKSYKDYPLIIKDSELNNLAGINVPNRPSQQRPITEKINYVIKKGDTLSGIASRYGVSYKILSSYNSITNPDLIYPNQIIKIPNTDNIVPSTYVVKKDDTLADIASRLGINWKNLYENNKKVIGKKPDLIKPGQILNV